MAAWAALLKEDGLFMRWKWYLPSTGEKMGLSALTGLSPSKLVAAQKPFLATNAAVPWSSGPQSYWHRGTGFLEDSFCRGCSAVWDGV